jgi:hypothetical protein
LGVTINVSGGISSAADIGRSVVDALTQYTQVYGPLNLADQVMTGSAVITGGDYLLELSTGYDSSAFYLDDSLLDGRMYLMATA